PYARLAKRELSRQIYQRAFDIVTGTLKPKDGETWPCEKIKSAEMTYSKTPQGFEIDATAPDLDPVKLKFPTK
ncbi:MAG TPA: hypothetical protein VNI20_01995, partial [Fimbriimonadaceae bacterium]|nr:hypothetical protein [Fimbriimonadaceae bacterium]